MTTISNLPIVHHQFLNSQQSFIANIRIFMAQELHNQLLASKLFNDTEENNFFFKKKTTAKRKDKIDFTFFLLGCDEHIRQYRSWLRIIQAHPLKCPTNESKCATNRSSFR